MKQKIDTLFVNGRIYSMETEGEKAEALGFSNGKVVFFGVAKDALEQFEPASVVDLQGKTALPGLGDSHLHFYAYCQTLTTVDLGGAKSKEEVIARLSEKAEHTPVGLWIKGSNFDQSQWEGEADQLPTREDLDQVSVKHPIIIKRVCLHTVVANSLALEKAGIGSGFDFGSGGTVELDEQGCPNGILREQASKIYNDLIPDPMTDPAVKKETMIRVLADASSKGLTMMHTYAAEIWKYMEDIEDYKELDREGKLPLRVTVCLDRLFDQPVLTSKEKDDPFRKVQLGAYKLFADGSLGSRSAALYQPYEDDPGNCGIMVTPGDQMNEKVLNAYRLGLQPAIHCIGDRGLGVVLTAIENCLKVMREEGMTQAEQDARRPFRLIHVQMLTPELLVRMKKLPVVLDIQPTSLATDLHWIRDRVGQERADQSYIWKRLMKEGLIETGGSDSPVETFDPFVGVYCAVTRQDLNGYPEGGFMPEERLSVYEALSMYTKNVPAANGEQAYLGTLVPGKFADMTVVDRDPFEIEPKKLLEIKVEQTWLAGQLVFARD